MPGPMSGRVAGAAAATLAGLPIAAAAFLRFKYGPKVFEDLVDIRRQMALLKTLEGIKQNNIQLSDFIEEHAQKTPDKAFILYKDEVHSYGDLDKEANKLAHFVQRSPAVACKDTVAIFMLNEPGFVVSWLAFAKLGLRIALLNYNLRGEVLLHFIKACNVKVIACGKDKCLLEALGTLMSDIEALGIIVWVPGGPEVRNQTISHGLTPVDTQNESDDPIPRSFRQESASQDVALFIFTSGTTGLPKPAKITHYRTVASSYTYHPSLAFREDDVVYITLPLYHSAAFNVAFSGMARVGGTLVLSSFSARRFWDEVREYQATIIPYIGEMCRYLLTQPPVDWMTMCRELFIVHRSDLQRLDDGKYNKIRYAIGNGLSADIWEEFQKRFNIERIVEFYGLTEGTFSLINVDGRVGSVGRYSPLLRALIDVLVIVKCNLETGQPLRGPDGKCLLTPTGETGVVLFRLTDKMKFDGYLGDKNINERKLVRDVKKNGDLFMNTGDLLVEDKDGYLYFKDRLGDTFRWKGENVATTEVAHVLNNFPGVQDVNVYGVHVPGHDGRAGMAAISLMKDRPLDLKSFYDHVVRSLPLYACPKFLRIMKEMDITGTFKHKKTKLATEGFDLNVILDPLFFMDMEKKTYAALDSDALRRVVIGQARL